MERNSEELLCPVCGSKDITSERVLKTVGVPSSTQESVSVFVDTCGACGENGDFGDRNDSIIEQGISRSEEQLVEGTIKFLSSLGITMAYMERALGLPQRTTMRWKAGEHSASVVALLQLIRTYPWLLKVAERGFDKRYAQAVVLEQAGIVIQSALQNLVVATQPVQATGQVGVGFAFMFFSGESATQAVHQVPQSDPVNVGSYLDATA